MPNLYDLIKWDMSVEELQAAASSQASDQEFEAPYSLVWRLYGIASIKRMLKEEQDDFEAEMTTYLTGKIDIIKAELAEAAKHIRVADFESLRVKKESLSKEWLVAMQSVRGAWDETEFWKESATDLTDLNFLIRSYQDRQERYKILSEMMTEGVYINELTNHLVTKRKSYHVQSSMIYALERLGYVERWNESRSYITITDMGKLEVEAIDAQE